MRRIRTHIMASAATALAIAATAATGAGALPARFELQPLALPADGMDAFETVVAVDGRAERLALRRHSVRTDDFRLLVDRGAGPVEEAAPPPRTYRGTVVGAPGSAVAATLVDGRLTALAAMPDGSTWAVQPADAVLPGAPAPLHVAYDARALPGEAGVCGTGALEAGPPGDHPGGGGPLSAGGGRPEVTELAYDADVEFYEDNGASVRDTMYDIEQITNAVNVVYRSFVDIDHYISRIIVRTAEPDPYTETDSAALLLQFAEHWHENHGGVSRDTAHLMTGRDIDGNVIGRAYIGVICEEAAYGLSQSSFSSSFPLRVALTAHELGHNWDANHCDGDDDCAIMCSFIGSCTGDLDRFGSRSVEDILLFLGSRGCLFDCVNQIEVPLEVTTVEEAVYRTCWDGDVYIDAGSYDEQLRISEAVRLRAVGGTVVIGE